MTKPIHVLLVEDLPFIQRTVALIMSKLGAQLTIASTGYEALELAKKGDFDIIFMDIGLPDINGDIVTQQIRAFEKTQDKQTPIVALTANSNLEDHPTYIASGMQEVVTKPISIEKTNAIFKKYVL